MTPPPFLLPDVLVLAVGGVVGEAWMTGVLAGIEDAAGVDFRETEFIVGTSAGSIVGANLAAGRRPRQPAGKVSESVAETTPEPHAVESAARRALGFYVSVAAPVVRRASPLAGPTRRLGRVGMLAALAPRGDGSLDQLRREIDRLGVRFDGRLRVPCVDWRSGRRVVFGSPGAPRATVAEAVTASCSIPGRYRPVAIGNREYVDGGAYSPTNLDAAPASRGTQVLCLHTAAGITGGLISRGGPIVALSRAAAALEAIDLRRRGADVRIVGPDRRSAKAMGVELMDPRPRAAALAAGFAQGRALAA